MLDARISITTRCNAKCVTCPVWKYKSEDMAYDKFVELINKLDKSPLINRIMLNNTGDMYNHPNCSEMFQFLRVFDRHKPLIFTTNAGLMDEVPPVDFLIISFNGGTKETYEKTTGLSWDDVKRRIRDRYPNLRKLPAVEMHCLIYDGNAGTEDMLLKEWQDFPGRIRVSYKYDNQMRKDRTLSEYRIKRRIPCDYLEMLSIMPSGRVISCAHDFKQVTDFGNVFEESIEELVHHPSRIKKRQEHREGRYTGLCEKCNYNTPLKGRVKYLKWSYSGVLLTFLSHKIFSYESAFRTRFWLHLTRLRKRFG
ncbi:MAG: radical SAM/SPASM domain-containing protein [Promethearchaeota archaeon]